MPYTRGEDVPTPGKLSSLVSKPLKKIFPQSATTGKTSISNRRKDSLDYEYFLLLLPQRAGGHFEKYGALQKVLSIP